jgi:hypothetical protein
MAAIPRLNGAIRALEQGFSGLLASPERSVNVLELGRRTAGRT